MSWHKTSDRSPNEDEWVMVTLSNGRVMPLRWRLFRGWYFINDEYSDDEVLAWFELPKVEV